ncbi:hypothetical protein ['Paenibacillus yunnanensis' Narsing Rao et al. 2020]|nr:hypothetical protein [Paenibacillus tengchongensis]
MIAEQLAEGVTRLRYMTGSQDEREAALWFVDLPARRYNRHMRDSLQRI